MCLSQQTLLARANQNATDNKNDVSKLLFTYNQASSPCFFYCHNNFLSLNIIPVTSTTNVPLN